MIIRNAKLSDVDKIYNIAKSVKEFKVNDGTINFWPKEILENCINSKNNLLIILEIENNVVGFIIINYNKVFSKAIIENNLCKKRI